MSSTIASSLAGILVATTPIFTALLAIRLDHEERSEGLRLVGVGIGVAGVALLFGFDLGGSPRRCSAASRCVLASVGYAVGGFVVKHRLSDAPPIGVVACGDDGERAHAADPPRIATRAGERARARPDRRGRRARRRSGPASRSSIFYPLIATVGPARTMIVSYLAPGLRGRLRSGAAG